MSGDDNINGAMVSKSSTMSAMLFEKSLKNISREKVSMGEDENRVTEEEKRAFKSRWRDIHYQHGRPFWRTLWIFTE